MFNVVYMLENKETKKKYIGSTINLKNRIKYHKYSYNHNKNKDLANDLKKYGFDGFELIILEQCTKENLRQKEKEWIIKYDTVKNGYNMTCTTTPSERIKEFNINNWEKPEYKEKMSKLSSETQIKRLQNKDYKNKKIKELKKATDKMKRKVAMYDLDNNLIKVFDGVRDASRWLVEQGITKSKNASSIISEVCLGKANRKTAYKYKWKYIN